MHFPCLETKLNGTGIQRKFSVNQWRTWQTFTKFNSSTLPCDIRKSLCLLLSSTLPESFLHRPRKKSIEYILIEKFIWFFRKPKSIQRREIQTDFKMHFSKLSNCNLSHKLTSCLTERSLLSSKGFELVFVLFKILIVYKKSESFHSWPLLESWCWAKLSFNVILLNNASHSRDMQIPATRKTYGHVFLCSDGWLHAHHPSHNDLQAPAWDFLVENCDKWVSIAANQSSGTAFASLIPALSIHTEYKQRVHRWPAVGQPSPLACGCTCCLCSAPIRIHVPRNYKAAAGLAVHIYFDGYSINKFSYFHSE